jgi:hypothetical protein
MRATCVPIVIGDDMEGSVEKARKKGLPVLYLDNISDQHATPFRATFRKVRNEPEFTNPVKRPGSINLVGYPRAEEVAGLLSFLARLGVSVNCRMLPEVDLRVMRRYRAADLAVLFDTTLYDRTYEEVFGEIDLPTIRPIGPYGVEGTRRWLRTIADTLGRNQRFDELWNEACGPKAHEMESLKPAASGYTLGFVLDEERVQMLEEPRRMTGVPILEMLDEMGFGVELLCYLPSRGHRPTENAIQRMVDRGRAVATFSDKRELEERLRESTAQAFYSEHFFDRRLTRCGKAQFSVSAFRMGVEGAVETARDLLSACRMPFYRKYAGYLGDAFPT